MDDVRKFRNRILDKSHRNIIIASVLFTISADKFLSDTFDRYPDRIHIHVIPTRSQARR